MIKIKLIREDSFFNSLRKYDIFVDDKKVGFISNNEIKEIYAEYNSAIQVKVDWCLSNVVYVNNQYTSKYYIKSFNKNEKALIYITNIILIVDILLTIFFSFKYLTFLLIPAFFLLIYYYTFGRSKYLNIEPC